nr:MAG TPA: hypothetical protein [Caudoviricetes sp.]
MAENGVWRTVSGRRVFIKTGQTLSDAMRESGKFEEEKNTSDFKKGDFSDAKKLTQDIVNLADYDRYGLRVQRRDTEEIDETMEHTSKNFGGDFEGTENEGESLDGVSTIEISRISQMHSFGAYEGNVIYLLGSNDGGEDGYDPGEYIMKNPVVLAKMKFKNGKLHVYEKTKDLEESALSSNKSSPQKSGGTKAQMSEYLTFRGTMIEKYGEDKMYAKMTDAEMDKLERLERIAYKGK